MLCSIILPTRQRLPLLRQCIASIVGTAADLSRIEIILRMHRDDTETLRAIPELLAMGPVRIVIGDPMRGFIDLSRFYEEAIAIAKGKWLWVMNDDVIVETPGWDLDLARLQLGTIAMPETHKLGDSIYTDDYQTPFMWFPRWTTECYFKDGFTTPFDSGIWDRLRVEKWPTKFIPVVINHARAVTAEEDARRAEAEKQFPEEQCRH